MTFPSFEPNEHSPEVQDVGVAVKLGAKAFRLTDPVALYGAFTLDSTLMHKAGDDALVWVRLIVIRRDQPGVWSAAARENPRVALDRPDNLPPPPPDAREGGWFNLDLRQHLPLPAEPARYWLFAALGDHITEKMSFEVVK